MERERFPLETFSESKKNNNDEMKRTLECPQVIKYQWKDHREEKKNPRNVWRVPDDIVRTGFSLGDNYFIWILKLKTLILKN